MKKYLSEDIKRVLDFAFKIAQFADEDRSSRTFFMFQEAYGNREMEWPEVEQIIIDIRNVKNKLIREGEIKD